MDSFDVEFAAKNSEMRCDNWQYATDSPCDNILTAATLAVARQVGYRYGRVLQGGVYGNKKNKFLQIISDTPPVVRATVAGGCRRKVFITRANATSWLVAAEHLLNSFWSPCFSVKIVYNDGLWGFEHLLKREGPVKKGLQTIL